MFTQITTIHEAAEELISGLWGSGNLPAKFGVGLVEDSDYALIEFGSVPVESLGISSHADGSKSEQWNKAVSLVGIELLEDPSN